MTRFSALLPRRVSEAIGRLMKADKLMFEVDHGARRAYEERAAKSEPGLDEASAATPEAPSATPPEFGGLNLSPSEAVDSSQRSLWDESTTRPGAAASPPSTTAASRPPKRRGCARCAVSVLAGARGRVLEVGAGTGLNLELYPEEGIESLTLSEPDPLMVKRLREKLGESQREAELIRAPAEDLPFADDSFDTVTVTLVLCTVPDPAAALAEIRRGSSSPAVACSSSSTCAPRNRTWPAGRTDSRSPGAFSATAATATATPSRRSQPPASRSSELERDRLPKAPPIVRPLVRGAASVPG